MNYYNCIYLYINQINNKKYVGQAKDFNKRHREHINESKRKCSKEYNLPFHSAIRKYGIENFDIIILKENLKTKCLMNLYECYYIKKYNTLVVNNNGYNIANGGHNGNIFEGKTEEEINEIKKKMSESRKGKHHTDEAKQKIGEANKRRIVTEETKQKISESRKGMKLSEKTKQKISESMKGENHPMYGKHLSEEAKQKISENHADMKGKNNPSLGRLIERWDKLGNLLDIKYNFEYVKMGFKQASISKCCKGRLKSVGRGKGTEKFIFKYHRED